MNVFLRCEKLQADKLHTTLYSMKTDHNNLLKRDSFHAPQTFKGIPKGQFIRARHICSDDGEYQTNMTLLKSVWENTDLILGCIENLLLIEVKIVSKTNTEKIL